MIDVDKIHVILYYIPLNILFNVIHFYCLIPKCITNINYYYSTLPPSSLKLECEKLASEKVEIQRHYVMVRTKFKNEKKDFLISKTLCLLFCVVFVFSMLYVTVVH